MQKMDRAKTCDRSTSDRGLSLVLSFLGVSQFEFRDWVDSVPFRFVAILNESRCCPRTPIRTLNCSPRKITNVESGPHQDNLPQDARISGHVGKRQTSD